jgi:MoxR-like ATPase
MQDVRALNEVVAQESAFVSDLTAEVGKVVVGQTYMIERILIGLLTGGHVLLEGVPGWPRRSRCGPSATRFPRSFRASSSRRTCCPPT